MMVCVDSSSRTPTDTFCFSVVLVHERQGKLGSPLASGLMPSFPVRMQDIPSVSLAVIRRRVPPHELRRIVPEYCGLVWRELQAQGAKAGRHVAIYWNAEIALEVGAEFDGPLVEQHSVVRSATPAGPVATATFFGPYAGLGVVHQAIRTWCEANGHRLAGPNWEIYGHWQPEWDAAPSLIRTDVFYQIAPVGAAGAAV
jgi:effector-binding domain-containing protein